MKLFIWDEVAHVTGNWHNGGGVVVIAETLERARAMIAADEDRKECGALNINPDITRECAGPEHISIHRDAGCC